MSFINKIFRGDRVIWMIFTALCCISIVEVFSATSTLAYRGSYWSPIMRHVTFLLGGTGIVLLVHALKPKWFSVLLIGLPVSWLLLIATKLFGATINGSERWFVIFGVSFQPSEIAKLCLIGSIAFLLSKTKQTMDGKNFYWLVAFMGITCGIIFMDNFSTAFLLGIVTYLMMFVGQVPLKKMGVLTLTLLLAGVLFVALLFIMPTSLLNKIPRAETWKNRLVEHKDEKIADSTKEDPKIFVINDDNYQVAHAKIAVARGGLVGVIPGNSQQRDYLPQAYSDFIYAIIIEELGFVGGIVVLFLYVMLFVRSGIIASRCEKLFPKYLVMGSALLITLQALTNMAVATNLIPVTGQPLPLISRGGTSTLITCIYIGIILSVSRFENLKGIRLDEEYAEEIEHAEVETIFNEDLKIKNEELRVENEILKQQNEELQDRV